LKLNNAPETGFVVQLFELSKILVQKKMVKFHAQGACMYPCIRPKDNLYIEPKNIEEIKIGDIAVYRRHNRLFSHRTIDEGNNGGSNYIITRPDTAKSGNDGPIFAKDILGIVARIERKKKILGTTKKDYPLVKRVFSDIYIRYYYFRQYLCKEIVYIIGNLQQFKAYRSLARLLFIKSKKKFEFSLQAPISPKANSRFFREFSCEELLDSLKGESPICKWRISLNVNSKPAGSLSFVFKPANCPFPGWWLSETKIRIRYRRTIIEEKLFERADELLRLLGLTKIFISVFKDAYLERRIFKNFGFKEINNNFSFARVLMERKIYGSQ